MLHAQTRCRSVHVRGFSAGQKTVENQDWAAGRRAAGPSGPLGGGPDFSKTPVNPFLVNYVNVSNRGPNSSSFINFMSYESKRKFLASLMESI